MINERLGRDLDSSGVYSHRMAFRLSVEYFGLKRASQIFLDLRPVLYLRLLSFDSVHVFPENLHTGKDIIPYRNGDLHKTQNALLA